MRKERKVDCHQGGRKSSSPRPRGEGKNERLNRRDQERILKGLKPRRENKGGRELGRCSKRCHDPSFDEKMNSKWDYENQTRTRG